MGHQSPSTNHQSPGFGSRLIAWQRTHGRHDLPWQNTRDPYRIWLSEIMLQQTQVAAVIPYYQRFLARFSDLRSLAAASEDDVLAHWSGLGYYARGRNLHRAAQLIVEQHAGIFPCDFDAVCALPGIGRSTAAAICVFAFGTREAILDGNVKRVLARHEGIAGFPGDKSVQDQLWRRAEALLPEADLESYTQGLMDLGAGLCVRRRPLCQACPVAGTCVAQRDGLTERLPSPRPAKALPERETTMLILMSHGEVLLEKRPAPGIWGGLWCFPEAATDNVACVAGRLGVELRSVTALAPVDHGFTHYKLRIHPMLGEALRQPRAQEPGLLWLSLDDALGAALPAPVKRILTQLRRSLVGAFSLQAAG
ncbi:MAG TPA: A/G-specific adenine glycosylase [Burkholderiales bacterium]|nr:A/G-specific adenine glycosylase [Burkholderiales bacterium]